MVWLSENRLGGVLGIVWYKVVMRANECRLFRIVLCSGLKLTTPPL